MSGDDAGPGEVSHARGVGGPGGAGGAGGRGGAGGPVSFTHPTLPAKREGGSFRGGRLMNKKKLR